MINPIIAIIFEKDPADIARLRQRIAERLKTMVSANRMASEDYVWIVRRACSTPQTTRALTTISR
jgi:hypothetical protein